MSIGIILMAGFGIVLILSGLVGRVRWIPRMRGIEGLIGSVGARIFTIVLGLIWIGFVGYLYLTQP